MKKIVYKNVLKKFLTSFLLFMLLFYQIVPNVVWAKYLFGTQELSYDEWLKKVEEEEEDEKKEQEYKDTIKDAVKQYISINIYYDINDAEERENGINKLLKDRGSHLIIKGAHKFIPEEERGPDGPEFKFVIEEGGFRDDELSTEELHEYGLEGTKKYTYQEFKNFTGKSEEDIDEELKKYLKELYKKEIDEAQNNDEMEKYNKIMNTIDYIVDNRKSELTITAKGNRINYKIISVGIPGETLESLIEDSEDNEKKNSADLGGMLLSPVFYLVNFVADAIMSNLGRIMDGNGSLSGTDILISTPPDLEIDKTDTYKVNVNSFLLGAYQYPNIKYTPEEIFSGKIDLLSIDFISGKSMRVKENGNVVELEDNSNDSWMQIRKVIAAWYKVLRMIAIIGLLSVLIYTGIKIIISANAKDKAKYKEWIVNWFIAVAILFSMHYIMGFIIAVINQINVLLGNATQGIKVELSDGNSFVTNLMGLVRFMIQSENFMIKVGYEVMYVALIVFTIKFTIVYLKRVLNMAFLTLIAPIVALTYPIDKLNDGSAQGFNMWLKEYIFNALLQPMHYIMYYILVGSAVSIAASNPIYGIVVLMFMTEAERLLKKIFGFDKAGGGTVGGMAGAFAAGAIASNIKDIAKFSKLGGGNAGKGGSGDGSVIESPKPTKKDTGIDAFLDQPNSNGSQETQQNGLEQQTSDESQETQQDSVEQQTSDESDGTQQERMLDAYDDNFNTADWNPAERDAMAREANGEQKSLYASEDEFYRQQRQDLVDYSGMTEEEADAYMLDNYGTTGRSTQEEIDTSNTSQNRNNSKAASIYKGISKVGKRLAKPVWDFNHGAAYNGKRLLKKAGRAAVGFSVGTAAAAVEAGISITDGKYNPMEGVGTFSAGYIGGGKIANGVGSLYNTYIEGATEGNKDAIMERARKNFADREDVIAFNQKNYKESERKQRMERERDNYLPRGVWDLNEMKKCMKYADSWIENNHSEYSGLDAESQKRLREQADRRAVAAFDFRKTLQEEQMLSAVNDPNKRERYIRSKVESVADDQKAITEARYRAAFKAVSEFNDAQK